MSGDAGWVHRVLSSRGSGWEAPRKWRLVRLAVVAGAHWIVFALLWYTAIATMPILVVPVSVQMVAPQTELVTSPEPLSQKTPKPRQIEPPKLRSVAPDAPVVASVSWPMPPPEPPAAPPPAAAITAPDTFSAAPKIELPLSAADYLINPAPTYPPVSRRLMEQGKVLLHVRVDAQGLPTQIELKRGSGFSRLDDAALATVQRWRFVPGKRNGVPESMWVEVPIEFRLS